MVINNYEKINIITDHMFNCLGKPEEKPSNIIFFNDLINLNFKIKSPIKYSDGGFYDF